jgi:hypothetical protein
MQFRRLHLALAILLLVAPVSLAQAQKAAAQAWTEWETLSPEGEEFSVSMPKNPTAESTTFPYHKMELNARLYLAKSPSGPVLAIASLSGIKSNPAAYSDFARFNSYMDAFKDFFPPKVRTNALTKMTLLSSRPFNGHTGRSYRLTIGDLTGSVHAYATRKRFYAIVSLNTKKDDALAEKFLSSFVLPERQVEQPRVTASATEQVLDPNAPQKPDQNRQESDLGQSSGNEGNVADPAHNAANNQQPQNPNQPQTPAGDKNSKRPIAGGILNGKAIYLPIPEVPAGDVTGVVLVAVVIDEQGSVIEARAVSGPQPLHAAAVNAARLARFSPTLLMGEPVRVSGTLSYNFVGSN